MAAGPHCRGAGGHWRKSQFSDVFGAGGEFCRGGGVRSARNLCAAAFKAVLRVGCTEEVRNFTFLLVGCGNSRGGASLKGAEIEDNYGR